VRIPNERAAPILRLAIAAAIATVLYPSAAEAAPGGIAIAPTEEGAPATPSPTIACSPEAGGVANGTCPPLRKARLLAGRAVPPAGSPPLVRRVIRAANRIRTTPYVWGGGHTRWWDRGYDCSGSVSYALHGADLVEAPMTSGELAGWGEAGRGRWITIYANARHVFAVIDGLRWDTVGDATGTGPRWHEDMVPVAGYVARHPFGY
jgi:cell wall-associated NlpC family hydrolase